MKNFFIYGFASLFLTFNSEKIQSQDSTTSLKKAVVPSIPTHFSDDLVYNDELYTVVLRVDKQKNGNHVMNIQMLLKKNSYFVSPNAKRDFSGRFSIVWIDAVFLNREQAIIETPLSVEEFDSHPLVQGPINWVRVNTTYKQPLKVLTEKDFDVSGYLQFTIEPRCTMEKVPFKLSYEKGRLSVKLEGC